MIDAGKTFYNQIIEHLPKLGVRQIDAVLLTHGHAGMERRGSITVHQMLTLNIEMGDSEERT